MSFCKQNLPLFIVELCTYCWNWSSYVQTKNIEPLAACCTAVKHRLCYIGISAVLSSLLLSIVFSNSKWTNLISWTSLLFSLSECIDGLGSAMIMLWICAICGWLLLPDDLFLSDVWPCETRGRRRGRWRGPRCSVECPLCIDGSIGSVRGLLRPQKQPSMTMVRLSVVIVDSVAVAVQPFFSSNSKSFLSSNSQSPASAYV